MYGDVVHWRDPATVTLPMDVAFLNELAVKGRTFAQTRELTCFKFNAAWRRRLLQAQDGRTSRSGMLRRIESGVDFRPAELVGSAAGRRVRPVLCDRGAADRRHRPRKASSSGATAASRASTPHSRRTQLKRIDAPTRFDMAGETMPFEWHELEGEGGEHVSLDRTEPARDHRPAGRVRSRSHGAHPRDRDPAPRADRPASSCPCYGVPLAVAVEHADGAFILEAKLRRADVADTGPDFGITIDTGTVTRPIDVGRGADTRWLGVAVAWVELSPLVE